MFKLFKKATGFTLIELLIVIALLGVLAVGLLAALDPFEQLKKGTDSGVRNSAAELQSGMVRYYAIKNYMPWCTTADCDAWRDSVTSQAPTAVLASDLSETIAEIATTGELKSNFIELAGTGALAKIYLFGDNSTASVKVCYLPQSKSQQQDPNTIFSPTTGATGCVQTAGNTNGCLWCVQ